METKKENSGAKNPLEETKMQYDKMQEKFSKRDIVNNKPEKDFYRSKLPNWNCIKHIRNTICNAVVAMDKCQSCADIDSIVDRRT